MSYNFESLSPADFEDLSRDLIGRLNKVRFEAFAGGPDGGMDGRHASAQNAIVLQAKHYAGSSFAALKAQISRERKSLEKIPLTRYILTTTRPLSPRNKQTLGQLLCPFLLTEADILGPADLNALLRRFPDIEKSHIKLWLSGAAMLEKILYAASDAVLAITKEEIEAKVRIYAPNPSFNSAQKTLEAHHVLIISGPPGVGKTTLAEILSYAYISEGWDLVVVRSLEDGFARINDAKRQVFLFDDFLGKVALDRRALSHKDSDLARLFRRITKSPNARFILTTRAYIFEEARQVSEHLADRRLDVSKFVLDVGLYTRQIKARILYNHLLVSRTDSAHIAALIRSGTLPQIIDHQNYNPRIIEWMTDIAHIGGVEAGAYPETFLDALEHPNRLWDVAFRTHISHACRHLLIAMFFSSQYAVRIEELRITYESLHSELCGSFGLPRGVKDFEESLRTLEGSFVSIYANLVHFVNPSLRDYLNEYLHDIPLLNLAASSAVQSRWAHAVWTHAIAISKEPRSRAAIARAFLSRVQGFMLLPLLSAVDGNEYLTRSSALSNTDRVELLIDWWEASGEPEFLSLAQQLVRAPVGGLDPSYDGAEAIELLAKLRDASSYYMNLPGPDEMADDLEEAILTMFERGVASDELEKLMDAADEWGRIIGDRVSEAVEAAVKREFDDVRNRVREFYSESALEEHSELLRALAIKKGVKKLELAKAIEAVEERIAEVKDEASESTAPTLRAGVEREAEKFDDASIQNLFMPLLNR